MRTFTDKLNRTWTVDVNVDSVMRVRDLAKINLPEVIEGKLLTELANDPILLCQVIYFLCKPECDQRNVSDAEFWKAMSGDSIEAAADALMEELVGFFRPARRKLLGKALMKLKVLEQKALDVTEARLDSPELERKLEELLAPSGSSSVSVPESSA